MTDELRNTTPPTPMEVAIGDALAAECRAIFGSCWSNDVRWRLARAALKAQAAEVERGRREERAREFMRREPGYYAD